MCVRIRSGARSVFPVPFMSGSRGSRPTQARFRETYPSYSTARPAPAPKAIAACQRLDLPIGTHMVGGISAWSAQGMPVVR
jgi:hypothetical protein